MEVLIIGSGAREHALVLKASQSSLVDRVYCAPGNPGINEIADCVPIPADDPPALAGFAKKRRIGLTIVGPEISLEGGVVDLFTSWNLPIFGPTKNAAEIETSKRFSKVLMGRYGISTAHSRDFYPHEHFEALSYIKRRGAPIVIKEDGLAAGKGATVLFDLEAAQNTAYNLLRSGKTIIVEEYLEGDEISTTALCKGREFVPMLLTQDHKQIYDGGPNTGGMGVYTPLPFIDSSSARELYDSITRATLDALALEEIDFTGFLYSNIKLTPQGPKVLEHNARFGDPEAQAMLPLLRSDLVESINLALSGQIDQVKMEWSDKYAVSLSLVSGGYPEKYETNKVIWGVDEAKKLPDVFVFHAGTKMLDGRLVTSGGRVLSVVALGNDLESAVKLVYEAADKIHFDGKYCRSDIAKRGLI